MAHSWRLAAYSCRHSRRYISWLLTYLLSTAPVVAMEGAEDRAHALLWNDSVAADSAEAGSEDFVQISENNPSGYLQESPYLLRRQARESSGGGAAPVRHPAERIPTAAELHQQALRAKREREEHERMLRAIAAEKAKNASEEQPAAVSKGKAVAAPVEAVTSQPTAEIFHALREDSRTDRATEAAVTRMLREETPLPETVAVEPEEQKQKAEQPAPPRAISQRQETRQQPAAAPTPVVEAAPVEVVPAEAVPVVPAAKPTLGEELPAEMVKPQQSGEGDDSLQSRALKKISAAIDALRQTMLSDSEPTVVASDATVIPAQEMQEITTPAQPVQQAVQTPEVVISADDKAVSEAPVMDAVQAVKPASSDKATQKKPLSAPVMVAPERKVGPVSALPASEHKTETSPKVAGKAVPRTMQPLVEKLKQQAQARSHQQNRGAVASSADPDAPLEAAAAASSLTFLQELQHVVEGMADDVMGAAPSGSTVKNLADHWKSAQRQVSPAHLKTVSEEGVLPPMFQQATQPVTRAAEHSDTTEEPKVRTEEEASGMLESLARQLMTNVQFEMPEKEGEGGAFPARAVLRQAGKNTPLLSRQSLPVAETITDADEALLQRAGEETEAEVMPGAVPTKEGEALQYESSHYSEVQPYDVDLSRHRVGVSPQPEKADSEMRVVSIDIKPGDRPFSKWEAMHPDGHLQLVNVEEDAGLAPVKVRKVTRVIGGGVAVANPPQPEMVEAQLPVAVPVYADARTQVVTENIVPNAGIKTPLPIVIKAPVGVSSAASAPLPERRPVQSPSMPDVPGSIPREVVDVYQPRLSRETKQALEGLPAGLGTPKPQDTQPPLDVARRNVPDMEVVEGDVDMREAKGVQIAVKRPDFNADTYMEDAYHALMQGDLPTAMDRYQAVLEAQPNNTDAKFGLATTYHRRGELAMARSLYAEIIMVNRHHLEALNNLLVLVSQESPSEALAEMKKLEARNPDFGPIPAQMAALYAKNDAIDDAIASIQRAIHIDPTNLAYRYNGAVLMDRAGRREEAIEYYTSLKHSYERGEKVPANMAAIQERLTFLLSNRG